MFGSKNRKLLRAVLEGEQEEVARLLAKGPDLDYRDRIGRSALELAIIGNDSAIVEMLLEAGADPNAPSEDPRGLGLPERRPLDSALTSSDLSIVQGLLKRGAKPTDPSRSLSLAAWNPDPRVLAAVLAQNPDVNRRESNGVTALMIACGSGNLEHVRMLVRQGADPSIATNEGETGLTQLLRYPNSALKKAAFEAALVDSDINRASDLASGAAPVHGAAPTGPEVPAEYLSAVQLLVDHGADAKRAVTDGTTSLHIAVRDSLPTHVIECLLRAGADPEAKDAEGNTPLELARNHPDPRVHQLLSQHR